MNRMRRRLHASGNRVAAKRLGHWNQGDPATSVHRIVRRLSASEVIVNISDKRRQELYDAIYQQIMDLRVKLRTGNPQPDDKLDYQLAQVIEKIWSDQKRVLGIVG